MTGTMAVTSNDLASFGASKMVYWDMRATFSSREGRTMHDFRPPNFSPFRTSATRSCCTC
jgi:hypothetical protein